MRLTPCMVWEFGWDHARARKAEMAPALGLGPWRDIGGGFVPATCRHRLFQTGGQYPWLGRDGLDDLLDGGGGELTEHAKAVKAGARDAPVPRHYGTPELSELGQAVIELRF